MGPAALWVTRQALLPPETLRLRDPGLAWASEPQLPTCFAAASASSPLKGPVLCSLPGSEWACRRGQLLSALPPPSLRPPLCPTARPPPLTNL